MDEKLENISRDDVLKIMIHTILYQEPILFLRFEITMEECYKDVLINAQEILNTIDNTYPIGHTFRRKSFVTDRYLFSFSYSKFICKKYLNNTEMMDDYINKKFKSMNNGKFNIKNLNENLSEFSVFFYIFCGIYFRSKLYNIISHLEYETDGANNKKYEYTFVLRDGTKLNFEVKALDCDPFSRDNEIFENKKFNDGDVLGKAYFPKTKLADFVGDVTQEITEITSNYRQLNKNVRRIKEKFGIINDKDINVGVIVINYGTSREEFFSYLLNNKYGLINVQDFGNIDNLILFSMCAYTTLMIDEIYDNEHIFSVSMKSNENEKNIFKSLRLDNYIVENGIVDKRFDYFRKDKFQLYRYIKRNGFMTIQPYDIEDNEVNNELDVLRNVYKGLDEIKKKIK